jgi:hypothetical protein
MGFYKNWKIPNKAYSTFKIRKIFKKHLKNIFIKYIYDAINK